MTKSDKKTTPKKSPKKTASKGSIGKKNKPAAEEADGYTVLARKYRPSTFEQLIGQDVMVTTLKNAFETGRIAQAYMLTGVRGVGKTTTARILARALNFTGGKEDSPSVDMPERGEHCQAIMESRHVDVLEMDAASHTGIDDIREIIESSRYKPVSARYKVYIIDEVHMLSTAAFNGLLKTLEEPPDHVKFIFATTEIRKVPVTVLSRCQRFDLHRVSAEMLIEHFRDIAKQEMAKIDEQALALIARAAEGSVRDGLSILDQAIARRFGEGAGNEISGEDIRAMLGLAGRGRIFDLFETVMQGKAGEALVALEQLYHDGAEPARIISELGEAVHIITRAKVAADAVDVTLSEAERQRAAGFASELSMPVLARAWQMLLKGSSEVQGAPNQLSAAEMILVRLAYVSELPSPEELARFIKDNPATAGDNHAGNGSGHGASISGAASTPQNRLADSGSPGPRMQGGSGALAVRPKLNENLQTAPEAVAQQGETSTIASPEITSLEDVIALAAEHRELKLRLDLEQYVQLVSFARGSIEFSPVAGAPKSLASDLGRKLREWTGERWMVAVSNEPGAPTMAARREIAEAAKLDQIKDHPLVRAVFEQFPEAEITQIIDKQESGKTGGNDDKA